MSLSQPCPLGLFLFALSLHFHLTSRAAEWQGQCLVMEGGLRHFVTTAAEDELTAVVRETTANGTLLAKHCAGTA